MEVWGTRRGPFRLDS